MGGRISPLAIGMLLHYFARTDRYAANEPEHRDSWAVRELHQKLSRLGLIERDAEGEWAGVDAALRPYIEALCSVPLPVRAWVMPSNSKPTDHSDPAMNAWIAQVRWIEQTLNRSKPQWWNRREQQRSGGTHA